MTTCKADLFPFQIANVYWVSVFSNIWFTVPYIFRQCLELLSNLQVEDEETLLSELQQLKEEEATLVGELEAVEEQRAAVAEDLAQCRVHSQQLDAEELQ